MKYTLIDKTPQVGKSLLEIVLQNRDIQNLDTMLSVPRENELSFELLDNIAAAVTMIIEGLKSRKIFGILVDCDVDGNTSAATMYNYLKGIMPEVEIRLFFHEGKQHGLSEDVFMDIRSSDVELLIVVDAGSNDYEQLETLYNDGMEVIVLDHHECEYESPHAIVVNNQLSDRYTNKYLSGVGIVYKVCQGIDNELEIDYARTFLDLVALGNIADGMNMYELDTRYLVQVGMRQIYNTLIQAIVHKQAKSMGGEVNITTVGWNIAPMLNAVIRFGTMEDKQMMFEGLITDDREFCDRVVTRCLSIQRKQNNEVKKAIPAIEGIISSQGLANNKVIIVNAEGIIDGRLVGLVANKLLNIYKKPIILLHNGKNSEDILSGSVRSPKELNKFKSICIKTKEFIFCEGHGAAFGCSILKDNIPNATKMLNEALKTFNPVDEKTYEVDAVIEYSYLNTNDISQIGALKALWGNGVNEPLFVVRNVRVTDREISLIGKNNTIKITSSKVDCMKFFTNETEYKRMIMNEEGNYSMATKSLVLDLVCKFKINEWQGRVKPQLEIVDYTVKENPLSFF